MWIRRAFGVMVGVLAALYVMYLWVAGGWR